MNIHTVKCQLFCHGKTPKKLKGIVPKRLQKLIDDGYQEVDVKDIYWKMDDNLIIKIEGDEYIYQEIYDTEIDKLDTAEKIRNEFKKSFWKCKTSRNFYNNPVSEKYLYYGGLKIYFKKDDLIDVIKSELNDTAERHRNILLKKEEEKI